MLTYPVVDDLKLSFPAYDWHTPSRIDAPAVYAMLLARDRADHLESAGSVADWEREFEDTWLLDPLQDALIAYTPQGSVAALAFVNVNPHPQNNRRAYPWVEVHPAERGDGSLFRTLLAWAEGRGRAHLASQGSTLPALLGLGCDERLGWRRAVLEQFGYQPVRYFYRMRRDLNLPIPPLPDLGELRLAPYTPELDRAMFAAFNESFQDHWNFEPVSYEDWVLYFTTQSPHFRPDLTRLVLAGDEVVAFSLNWVMAEKNAQYGKDEGWVGDLGTIRPWRKRGVASALLIASMQAFKAAGLGFAALGVDSENTSGALRLYQNLGFAVERCNIAHDKPLAEV